MAGLAALVAASGFMGGNSSATVAAAQGPTCGPSSNVPLTDLTRPYRGLDYGLYPGRRTTPPAAHLNAGIERASTRVRPLDRNGRPSPDGSIILMSLGMSNTAAEFGWFVNDARTNPAINRKLTILNGSLSGADAAFWTNPNGRAWQNAIEMANAQGRSVSQVQVVWIKQAQLQTVAFPAEVDALARNLDRIIAIAGDVFPNLQMVFLSSRTRAGAPSRRGPGEPQAYETAFAVRQVIQKQIEQASAFAPDSPWLGWGPYLWSNGTARSDGFVWDCRDVQADLLHPTDVGSQKVAEQLMAFFMASDTTAPWFLEPSLGSRGSTIPALSPSPASGPAPLTVTFDSNVPGAVRYFWSFPDGTFSTSADPRKTFHLNGTYTVQLTVADSAGRWSRASTVVRVGP